MLAKRFARTITKDSLFLLVSSPSESNEELTLPPAYWEYKDVFSEADASKLPFNKVVHEIWL
jgi:hypothetical protein